MSVKKAAKVVIETKNSGLESVDLSDMDLDELPVELCMSFLLIPWFLELYMISLQAVWKYS
jgi:hypothetical protein